MSDQLVKRQQFLVRLRDSLSIRSRGHPGTGFQRVGGLAKDWVLSDLPRYLPQSDEPVYRRRETHREHTVIARRARRLEIEVERTLEAVRAQQHQYVQPVERIHQAHADVHVVLQPVAVVDIEVPQLAG